MKFLLILVLLLPLTVHASVHSLVLAQNGKSRYRIVVADNANPGTQLAASELRRFFKEMTGAELKIVSNRQAAGRFQIRLGVDAVPPTLGDEGYVLRTQDNDLIIAGHGARGTLYGVYGLLEDHLGCRWFTPQVSHIPHYRQLRLKALDETIVPALEYRDPFVFDCMDADWSARNRMNGSSQLDPKHGGSVRFGAGLFVHTFNALVPPDKYFAEHPEYFSEINGKRIKDNSQLCCTNEKLIELVIATLRERIRQDPGAFVYSVSQNDWGNYCQCANCRKLIEQEDTPAAPLLYLVNRVAKEFPDKVIETLAYQWSRKPPRTMKPLPNVIIRLCSIECCFSHPLDECDRPENRTFVEDLRAWARICDRLWIWNYETNFANYLLPFPNYHVWDKNIRFFVRNHVRGLFTEDDYQSPNGELSALGGYVRAKLLWNPNADARRATDEFLEGVYGRAAKPIRAYLNLLSHKVVADKIHIHIFDPPVTPYLTDKILAEADKLWDQAEAAVAGDPVLLARVQIARSSLDYAFIERARQSGQRAPDPTLPVRLERFVRAVEKGGMTRVSEGRDMSSYLQSLHSLHSTP